MPIAPLERIRDNEPVDEVYCQNTGKKSLPYGQGQELGPLEKLMKKVIYNAAALDLALKRFDKSKATGVPSDILWKEYVPQGPRPFDISKY